MILDDNRVRVIAGHYGTGKSEFSVNYAMKLAELKRKVAIADIDIVNMYFRSREKRKEMEEKGVRVIGGQIDTPAIEVPSLSSEIYAPLQDKSYDMVLDVGGDPVGARTLGVYHQYLIDGEYDMFFIVNANRPETSTADKAVQYLRMIENVSRTKITGLVNNTHLLKSTTVEDVLKGNKLALEIQELTGIKLRYNSMLESVAQDVPKDLAGDIFTIKLYLRDEWML